MYVAPKSVSGRVVYTLRLSSESTIENFTSAPVERPIQFRCISFTPSGQSTVSSPCNKRSA